MGKQKYNKAAKTLLAVVLAIVVIFPLTLGRRITVNPVGDNAINTSPVVYGTLGDDGEEYGHM